MIHMSSFRARSKQWVQSSRYEKIVLSVILINSITLGLETSSSLMAEWGVLLTGIDKFCLYFFSLEISFKIFVLRREFLRDPWSLFDFFVVGIAWLPSTGAFSVFRALRILRALRVISTVPQLRRVVSGLLNSLPGLGAVSSILMLLFYVASVMATKLFGQAFPDWFGDLPKSAYSLFQIMTLESWSMGIVRPVMERFPYAPLYFIPFIVVTTFTTLNLLVAVMVNAMQSEAEKTADEREQRGHEEREAILRELRQLRDEIKQLRR
jgi:voltage-gated sodium channel